MKRLAIVAMVVILVAATGSTALAARRPGSGAGKASLYNTAEGFDCEAGATDLSDGPYGFVVMNASAADKLIVVVSLKGATPKTTYDLWINQDPGGCPLSEPTAVGVLKTNIRGNGNATLKVAKLEGAIHFWVSAVGEEQLLRSPSVVLD